MVWCPNDVPEELNGHRIEDYYPGDEYVDYVGIGVLNFGTAATWSRWWTFDELFGQFYEAFAKYGKPLMITEFGSLVVGGDRGHWFADAFRQIPDKYPQLKSIVFFHYPVDKTITSKVVNWHFVDDPATLDSIRTQISRWPDSLKFSAVKPRE
jgi:beta-mannanase